MNCLILTEWDDTDSIWVKQALEQVGHQVNIIYHDNSAKFINTLERLRHHDVVWWRCNPNILPKIANVCPKAWWINAKDASARADFKLLQLKLSYDCGMTIPTTLCSANPNEIEAFQIKYQEEGTVCYPLYQSQSLDDVFNSSEVGLARIYQQKLKQKYQLRVTCFGYYIVAAKLTKSSLISVVPYVIPNILAIKIRELMRQMGLVFGCFDFILTPEGEYVLINIDPQGDFLWIEEKNPGFKMLDIFVNFLLGQTLDYHWNPRRLDHTLQTYQL